MHNTCTVRRMITLKSSKQNSRYIIYHLQKNLEVFEKQFPIHLDLDLDLHFPVFDPRHLIGELEWMFMF